MTVKDFLSVLMRDRKIKISIQSKDKDGIVVELYNDDRAFGQNAIESYYDNTIDIVKIEKKQIFIFI